MSGGPFNPQDTTPTTSRVHPSSPPMCSKWAVSSGGRFCRPEARVSVSFGLPKLVS